MKTIMLSLLKFLGEEKHLKQKWSLLIEVQTLCGDSQASPLELHRFGMATSTTTPSILDMVALEALL
jgi:hypothetical protein